MLVLCFCLQRIWSHDWRVENTLHPPATQGRSLLLSLRQLELLPFFDLVRESRFARALESIARTVSVETDPARLGTVCE